jgi:carboxyl-terminal processing protease
MPFLALLLFFAAVDDPVDALSQDLKKLVDVFVTVDGEAADPVAPDTAFYQGAIPGMLRTLDPHSVFFNPQQYEQLKEMQKSESKGFGAIVSVIPGRVIVLQPMPGTPSERAGLAAGDEILAINGIQIARLEPEQLVQLLTEARQHQAVLDVRRPGNARLIRLTLTPELVQDPSVDRAFMLSPGIGYLRVTGFEASTGKLVKEAIEKLGGVSLKGLVLDLRDNPGGAVQAAVDTASLFLPPDQLIFSIRGRSSQPEEVRVPKLSQPYAFPLAVLINTKSASAAEIVTGALQDHDRARVFGEPSYGKGIVQNVFPLSGNSAVALTIAFYYTPSGRSIQKPLSGGTLDAATSALKGTFRTDAGREVQGGGGIQPDEVIYRQAVSPLVAVLEESGALTNFATEYLQAHPPVDENFEVTPAILDQLQLYLSARDIQPGVGDWLRDREWIQSRVKQDVLNLTLGVAKGDEVEMRRDPVVRRAVQILTESQR